MANLACRACRQSLSADIKGCAICESIRRNLIAADEGAEDLDRPALSTVSAEVLAFLRERATWYRAQLKAFPNSQVYAREATANANALSKLLEAARRLQQDGVAAVKQMSFKDRAGLFVAWYADLPPAYRAKLREELGKHESLVLRPVAEIEAPHE